MQLTRVLGLAPSQHDGFPIRYGIDERFDAMAGLVNGAMTIAAFLMALVFLTLGDWITAGFCMFIAAFGKIGYGERYGLLGMGNHHRGYCAGNRRSATEATATAGVFAGSSG